MEDQNPNSAQIPRYEAEEFKEERQILIDAGLNPKRVATLLTNLWFAENKRDRALWRQGQQEAAATADEDEAPQTLLRFPPERELLDTFKEEWERRKLRRLAPFTLTNRRMSLEVTMPSLPALVATCKLRARHYCEPWFFTNAGFDESDRAQAYYPDDDCLSLVRWHDDSVAFLPTAFFQGKSGLTRDKDLSWEQFEQATYRMIKEIKDCDWQKQHVDMYVKFWSNITNHKWRHSRIEWRQRALLEYQENQRRWWHIKRGNFDLTNIDDKILEDTYHRIQQEDHYRLIQSLAMDRSDLRDELDSRALHTQSSGYKRSTSPPRGSSKRRRRRSSHARRHH